MGDNRYIILALSIPISAPVITSLTLGVQMVQNVVV